MHCLIASAAFTFTGQVELRSVMTLSVTNLAHTCYYTLSLSFVHTREIVYCKFIVLPLVYL
jgi:hypothetical protein